VIQMPAGPTLPLLAYDGDRTFRPRVALVAAAWFGLAMPIFLAVGVAFDVFDVLADPRVGWDYVAHKFPRRLLIAVVWGTTMFLIFAWAGRRTWTVTPAGIDVRKRDGTPVEFVPWSAVRSVSPLPFGCQARRLDRPWWRRTMGLSGVWPSESDRIVEAFEASRDRGRP